MSAAIKQALINMNEAVKKLETAAGTAAKKNAELKKRPAVNNNKSAQKDLFTVFTGGQEKREYKEVDVKAMASRLDGAIAKVEELLK